MPRPALYKCGVAGCNVLSTENRCPQHRKREEQRPSSHERGYDWWWREASLAYRKANPLCVNCLLRGKVRKVRCVDHIIPKACCPELEREPDNWAALCIPCHTYKTTKEPKQGWTPDASRVVVCGLPGTGKSTWAKERGVPYFDADERELSGIDAIVSARNVWMLQQDGPCTVIVASTVTASSIAARLRGVVKHCTTVHVERSIRT